MSEPMVVLEVKMTPEKYVRIKKDADWEGCSVADYLVKYATGDVRQGC